jgi:hypothetical protein
MARSNATPMASSDALAATAPAAASRESSMPMARAKRRRRRPRSAGAAGDRDHMRPLRRVVPQPLAHNGAGGVPPPRMGVA